MLSSDLSFKELLDRVRIGEERACQELVEKYAGEIRRVIRIRLREPLLRSTIDTTDIYQSVLMDFFARMKLGEYQFDLPTDLVKLLLTMSRHKFLNHARRARVRRIVAPTTPGETSGNWLATIPAGGESPSEIILGAELLQKAQSLLSEEERRIAEHHRRGKEWNEIAQLMNESPEAIRKRLTRAISRVLEVLQLKREDA